jgi:hypothetical protein
MGTNCAPLPANLFLKVQKLKIEEEQNRKTRQTDKQLSAKHYTEN